MQLKPGTLLQNGEYKIIKVLGQGGFGITYLAEQTSLRRKVAIKEFFMKEYCERDTDTSSVSLGTSGSKELVEKFREKFVKEAQNIASFSHNNIIKIYGVFMENNTAYYVMEYLDCGSLSDYLSDRGRLSEKESLTFIRQIADALSYIHEHRVNHLDIKPGNILLDKKQNAILIDFGLSKHYDEKGGQTSSTPVGISHGYAPLEQYKHGGVSTFSPSTDIYSLGATLYKLLTGTTPPEADDVNENGLSFPANVHISGSMKKAIAYAMQPKRKDRPQSIAEFLKALDEKAEEVKEKPEDEGTDIDIFVEPDLEPEPKPEHTPKPEPVPSPKSKNWMLYAVLAVVLGVVGYFVYDGEKKKEEKKRIEVIQQAQARIYQEMLEDKNIYMSYINDGDKLVENKEYSESIEKYEQARKYEIKYSNTKYSFEFNKGASNKISEAKAEEEKQTFYNSTHGSKNGHDWVDLGLSVKWATCNLGAGKPEEYGEYFAWGETSENRNNELYNMYVGDISGNKQYDAAYVDWGSSWRLPTMKECEELVNRCVWKWTTQAGKSGYVVTGPNGNSIFLPAAGCRKGSFYDIGKCGYYWNSMQRVDRLGLFDVCYLYFGSGEQRLSCSTQDYARSIRPVSY